jgi:alanine dehydrogenase
MTLPDYIEAVEKAFRALGTGHMRVPQVVHIPAPGGGFHIKSAAFVGGPGYVAVKVNGNFPGNPQTHGLPTIQGAIILCDSSNGRLLAVMDSSEVTEMRTAAATAVAAKYLAHPGSVAATIIGCGVQGRAQALALMAVLPLQTLYARDPDWQKRDVFVERLVAETGCSVVPIDHLADGTLTSQVIVTCTPSRQPFLRPEHVAPGTFIEAGAMTRGDVYAELADIVTGSIRPAFAVDDIVVFDSTGSAIQDVAVAGLIYERACADSLGASIRFS